MVIQVSVFVLTHKYVAVFFLTHKYRHTHIPTCVCGYVGVSVFVCTRVCFWVCLYLCVRPWRSSTSLSRACALLSHFAISFFFSPLPELPQSPIWGSSRLKMRGNGRDWRRRRRQALRRRILLEVPTHALCVWRERERERERVRERLAAAAAAAASAG